MKKIIQIILICLLTCFSFYYTEKIIDFTKNKDPIMIKINEYKEKKEVPVINASLTKTTMLVGESGLSIDVDKSYEKMKKLDEFNANLLEYIEVMPNITKENNLDKLIEGKNTKDKKLSFVFVIEDLSTLEEIIYILDQNEVSATFFMDGKLIENNLLKLNDIFKNDNTLGLYSYDNKYTNEALRYQKGMLERNINNASYYCLYINEEFFTTCIKNKVNTIKPTLIENNLYDYLKEKKQNGYIYQIKNNDLNIKELNSSLIYLKQKGYEITNINNLLEE